MTDLEEAHRRVMRSLRLGRRGRFIVAVVRTGVPMVHARIELRGALRAEGFEIVEQDISAHPSLASALEEAMACGRSDAVALVYGFESLVQEERRDRLRRSSFGRARLRLVPRPFIVLMRDTTWRWIGHELPDLARWVDGPVMLTEAAEHEQLARWGRVAAVFHERTPYYDPLEDFSVDLGPFRGTPIASTISTKIDSRERPRVLAIAGCPGSGRRHGIRQILSRIEPDGISRRLIRMPSVSPVFDRREGEQQELVSYLRERIERVPGPVAAIFCNDDTPLVESALLACVTAAQKGTNKWVLCSVGSELFFARDYAALRQRTELLYLAPVAVRHRDGTPSAGAIEALGALIDNRLARVGLGRSDVFESGAFEPLALASGGLASLLLEAAWGALSVANTDRPHFEIDDLQRVTSRDAEIAVSQLGVFNSAPRELLDTLEGVARTGDPTSAARIEPYALVYVDGDDVFGAVHPLLLGRVMHPHAVNPLSGLG